MMKYICVKDEDGDNRWLAVDKIVMWKNISKECCRVYLAHHNSVNVGMTAEKFHSALLLLEL